MTTLTGVLNLNLEVKRLNDTIYIGKKSLFALISNAKDLSVIDRRNVSWIPYVKLLAPSTYEHTPGNFRTRNTYMHFYTLEMALAFIEYIKDSRYGPRLMLIQVIRDHFEEYLT